MNRRHFDWKPLKSIGEMVEFEKLESWAEWCCLGGGKSALEIGAYHGKSTVLLSQFFDPLYVIDLWGNLDSGLSEYQIIGQENFVPFITNIISFNLIDHVIPIVSSSSVLDRFPFLGVDFVYIDASHEYLNVKKDLMASSKHLCNTGIIVCDDYKRPGWGYPSKEVGNPEHGPNDPWIGVAQAVDEFLLLGEFEIKDHFLGKVVLGKR